ncbi:MAG: hypothetical protein HKO65_19310 [Gemmatimonadetes bacterium]|nr:hypothetical protein [Gemmatimonadota bacterium]NNM07250.1 hypothetical protein [Gemmatimonadota bacterium]
MKNYALLPLFAFGLALILSSCATSGSTGSRSSSNRLTADQIAEVSALTAYEVVEYARPQWLRPRALRAGATSAMGSDRAGPVVYLDGVRVGTLEELRRLRADAVAEMQYLSPSDATNRFGTNHDSGAILVTTR